MMLFPYAKDVEYDEGILSLTLQFLTMDNETQVSVRIETSSELSEIMDRLIKA
jgi:hypothetical protein